VKITGSTPFYGLFGAPVSHSLSPLLQNGWIQENGFDGVYLGLPIGNDRFELALEGMFQAGLQGANVTAPFKERAAEACIERSIEAQASGSVNCLVRQESGFSGDSTDGNGFIADLDARAPNWRALTAQIVILGAGGAARSILQALCRHGLGPIALVNRSPERAHQTAATVTKADISVYAWADMAIALKGASLIINATNAGMNHVNPMTLDFSETHRDALIYDTVYAPRATALLESAKVQNRQTLDGLGMLVGQGALAFQAWFGVFPDLKSGMKRLEEGMSS
jgi:shikimate dehydrogenase